jgi:hypothetical protein
MSIFNFLSNGKSFNVKGPAGLTLEQAKQIFDKQSSTGSLVGLKPGSILSAVNQAAAGLKSAIASVGQGLSGITGALGSGISSAAGQIGSLVKSGGSAIMSLADKATSTIKGIVGNSTPTNPIGIADFAKQDSALTSIGKMGTGAVTGVLAQAKNLVGQGVSTLTNGKGLGSFGLNVSQLEKAGYVKPGTSKFLAAGSSALSSVLKSPSVFTGKDGIKDVNGLLGNAGAQSKIQQGLMVSGTAALKEIGVPVDKLPANLQAGLSLNAAKSLADTEKLVKGLPLPTDIKATMDKTMISGSFAANFSNLKVPEAFKETEMPVPATDTANRETLNAATDRILGSDKIPAPNYGPVPIHKVGTYDATGRRLSAAEIQALMNAPVNPADANGFA